jgi:hypothetical protein
MQYRFYLAPRGIAIDRRIMECGGLLPLSARLLAGAPWAGSELPAMKAGASSCTPNLPDFGVAPRLRVAMRNWQFNCRGNRHRTRMNIDWGLDKRIVVMISGRRAAKNFGGATSGFLAKFSLGLLSYMETANVQFAEPQQEAAFFYGLFLRGHSLQKLREDIDVPPHVLETWRRLAMRDPMYHGMLERMLTYRKHVLAIFESLVFREMLVTTRVQ